MVNKKSEMEIGEKNQVGQIKSKLRSGGRMLGRRAELRIGLGERVGGEDRYENERKKRIRKEQKRMEEFGMQIKEWEGVG